MDTVNQDKKAGTDRWAESGIFVALFFLYWRTLCPTVGVGDSGELITAAYTLGIPHPTGFPLYILSGKLFIHLFPFGEVAYRMNLFSALAAAGGGAVFYRLMRVLGNPCKTAISSALVLGCSLSFWSQATIARVYSLNALLICLCLYYGLLPVQNFRTRAWFFFWWGLALANHSLSVIVGILFLVLWLIKRDFFKYIRASYFIVPGLSLYLYIPLRSRMNPSLDIGNPETLRSLWAYLSRTRYWNKRYVETFYDVLNVIWHYLATLPEEFTWLGAALILVGIYYLWVKKEFEHLFIFLGLYVFNIVLTTIHGSIWDIFQWSRYLIPGYIGISLIIGYGLRFFFEGIAGLAIKNRSPVTGSSPSAYINKLLGSGLLIILPPILLWTHFIHNDRSEDYLAYDYNYKALLSLPKDAAIFPMGDNTAYPLLYLHKVLGIRPDVKIHMSYYEQDRWILLNKPGELFFTDLYNTIPPGTVLRPDGLLFRLMKPQDPPPLARSIKGLELLRGMDNLNLIRRDFLVRSLASKYWFFTALLSEPIQGKQHMEKLIRHSLDLSYDDDRAWERTGLIFYLKGDMDLAKDFLLGALRINPKNKGAPDILRKIQTGQQSEGE